MRLHLGEVPLHPALVHFPIAFWTAAPVAEFAGWLGAGEECWRLGRWLALAGLALALPAMAAGLLDAIASRQRRDAEPHVWRHAGLMVFATTCFLLALLFGSGEALTRSAQLAPLSLHVLGVASLLAGAHVGGRLAYGFRLPAAMTEGWKQRDSA